MAVYERRYVPYRGALTPRRSRFAILPRYAYAEIFSRRLFVAFFAACFVWPVILAVMIYLPHNLGFLKAVKLQADAVFGIAFDASFYYSYLMIPQGWLSLFLAFLVGPELVSPDLRNNAMPLYFSRPFSRLEYVCGKATTLIVLLSAITWVPGLLLFLLQSCLEGWSWFTQNLRIGAAILLASWIYIAVLCLISLSLSAYLKWKPLARLAFFAVFVVASGLAGVINLLLHTKWAGLINVAQMVGVVWAGLFGIEPHTEIPAGAAWASLLTVCGASVLLLARRVRAHEVVR